MTTVRVDKRIPLPEMDGRSRVQAPKPSRSQYPFQDLGIGHSFEVPRRKAPSVSAMRTYFERRLGHKYVARTSDTGALRVWRVR